MSLLGSMVEKAAKDVTDSEKQKAWVESGFDAAMDGIRGEIPSASDDETSESRVLRETAEFGLDKLEKNREVFVGLGKHGLQSTLALVGLGRYDEAAKNAALLALRETASWDQVTAAIDTTAEDGNQKKRELDAQVKSVKGILIDLGASAAKSLFMLLVSAI